MYQPLVPCASCHRHVRASEAACPFCSSALPRATARDQVATTGLSRAAVLALGAALSIVACSDDDSGTGNKTGEIGQGGASAGSSSGGNSSGGASSAGNGGAAGDGSAMALYGAPPPGGAGGDTTAPAYGAPPQAGAGGESAGPVYGAPPPAGAGGAAGGPDDPGSGNADYGAPPKP